MFARRECVHILDDSIAEDIEISVLTKSRRKVTILAQTYCSLYSLAQSDLFEVLKNYPAIKEELMREVESRLQERPFYEENRCSPAGSVDIIVTDVNNSAD
ncbi:unnamed protein product [Dibothriocephalus latus]|uniref:Cyclic nucleotide-binding domain-containing protein n=1 Tax=Dibothriocephalus latus TaxID=60516 RepID=A0A3P7NNJ9_DIBLA|nr:unnamed protein product [Dibothriocephalus latus]